MSEQETLRLVMEAVDKFSPEMKKFVAALKGVDATGKSTHEQGKKHVKEHSEAYRELRENLFKVKETTTDVLRPAFNALGISVLSVAGSIAAVSEAVKGFGEYGEKLEFAHRASGLLTSSVRGLAEANQKYGVSADDTIKSLESFGQNMDKLHRKSIPYMNEWRTIGANAWKIMGSELASLDGNREAQLKRAMEILPTIRDTDQREKIAAILGLPPNWKYLTQKELEELSKAGREYNERFPFNEEAARKSKEAWDELLSTFRGIKESMSGEFAPGMTQSLHDLNDFIKSDNWKTIKEDVDAISTGLSGWNLGSIETTTREIKALFDAIKKTIEFIKEGPGDKNSWWNRPLFSGPNSLFGSGSSQQDQKTQENVKEGTRKGLEEFYQSLKAQQGVGGYTPLAYHPEGGGGNGGGANSSRFGNSEYPNLGGGGDSSAGGVGERNGATGGTVPKSMGKGPDGANIPMMDSGGGGGGGAASGTLAEQRGRFAEELRQNPALRNKVLRIMANEQGRHPEGTQAIAESMMNRALVRGTNLEKQARWFRAEKGGYYAMGNMGRGALENEKSRSVLESSLRKALAGSNISDYATDNSSGGLAADEHATGKFRFRKGYTGESFFAPGWKERNLAKRWDAWHQQVVASDANHGHANLRDMVRRGGRSPNNADMLKRGMRATDAGSLDGNAHLKIDLNGFPQGTRTSHSADGIFKQVSLSRGRPMAQASETS